MPTFFERACTALAREGYQVEGDRELGAGGMGVVVKARHVGLDHLVAVKVIRQEQFSVQAVARFKREAQILAKLSHPNIVRVLTNGVTRVEGWPFYVMEYLAGRTLADWTVDGRRLPKQQALKLGRDLLDALSHAHAHGIIHRDVKPANVFWDGEKAILVDFGIAKRIEKSATLSTSRTPTGRIRGTLSYMALEQLSGAEATPASDQYSAALVIFEAFTGRHWLEALRSQKRVWRGVPLFVRPDLKRALSDDASKRWRDVATFRRRLRLMPPPGKLAAVVALAVALVAVGLPSHGLELRVSRFADQCAGAAGDRINQALVQVLQGNADFATQPATYFSWIERGPTMRVRGAVCAHNDSISARIVVSFPSGAISSPIVARSDPAHVTALADTLALDIVREIWRSDAHLDAVLPVAALPHSARGRANWLVAERLFAQARWGEADSAYTAMENDDSACWLCSWRHTEVDKWIGRPFDSVRVAGVVAHLAAFPVPYQRVIRASRAPLPVLLDSLKAVRYDHPEFLPGRFMLADEMYHRGPLIGHTLRDAIQELQDIANERPDFLPAVEHLTWATTAAGAEREARVRLEQLQAVPPRDPYVKEVRALLQLGVTCRFEPRARCSAAIDTALQGADPPAYPDLAAGPRYLMTFDAPAAAIDFGHRFAAHTEVPALVESGLVAELSGYLALGQLDSARATANLLRGLAHPELTVLPAEFDGALLLLDPPDPAEAMTRWETIRADLIAHTRSAVSTPATRRRAAWMLLLLARRFGSLTDSTVLRRAIAGESGRQPMASLLRADALAEAREFSAARRLTDPLLPLQADSLGDPARADPFFRAVLHLLRAEWAAHQDVEGAVGDLQWYANNDVTGRLSGPPQVADIDWGFGTLARWRQARLLDLVPDGRRCDLYRMVSRGWADAEPRYRVRADTARTRAAALSCPTPT